jgi:hypothetical protein
MSSKLDKFFKSKDLKKEKELQKAAPKPIIKEDSVKIVGNEFLVDAEFGGKTVTVRKDDVTIEDDRLITPQEETMKAQWKSQDALEVKEEPVAEPVKEEKKPGIYKASSGVIRSKKVEVKMDQENFPSLADAKNVKDKELKEKAAAEAAAKTTAPSSSLFRPSSVSANPWSAQSRPPSGTQGTLFSSRSSGEGTKTAVEATSWR